MRRTFALCAVAVLLAACGSGGGSGDFIRDDNPRQSDTTEAAATTVPRTTQAPTVETTVAPTQPKPTTTALPPTTTTTVAPTTTLGECVLEPPLLEERLLEVPGFVYADYEVDFVSEGVDEINATPEAFESFSAFSRHIVTTADQHMLGTFELFGLRDRTMDADAVSELVLDMHNPGPVDVTTETVGDIPIVRSVGVDFDLWAWVDDGVAYTFWWNGFEGNEGYGTDFTRAFTSTMQNLPIPDPTVIEPEPGPALGIEDEALAARLVPVDGFFYEDIDLAGANEFYASFTEATPLERATIHIVVSEEQQACGGEYANVAALQLWELKDEFKGDPDATEELMTLLSVASEDSVSTSMEIDVLGETVTYAITIDAEGTTQGVFLWEHDGVVYAIYGTPGCLDATECSELVAQFVAGLITETLY